MEFTQKQKRVVKEMLNGGHQMVQLEKSGEQNNEESIHYVSKEVNISTRKAAEKIKRTLNYKNNKKME